MKKTLLFIAILSLVQLTTFAQDYGDFPKIEKWREEKAIEATLNKRPNIKD